MFTPGTRVEIRPSFVDGVEIDQLGRCDGWVVRECGSDVLVQVRGLSDELWITRSRLRLA